MEALTVLLIGVTSTLGFVALGAGSSSSTRTVALSRPGNRVRYPLITRSREVRVVLGQRSSRNRLWFHPVIRLSILSHKQGKHLP